MDTRFNQAQRETRKHLENIFNDAKVRRSSNGDGLPTYEDIVGTIKHFCTEAFDKGIKISKDEYNELGILDSVEKAGGALDSTLEGYGRVLVIEDVLETIKLGHDDKGNQYEVTTPIITGVQCRKTKQWHTNYTTAFNLSRFMTEDGVLPSYTSVMMLQAYSKVNGKTEGRNGVKQKGHAHLVQGRDYESQGKLDAHLEPNTIDDKISKELGMSSLNGNGSSNGKGSIKTVDLGHYEKASPAPAIPRMTVGIGSHGSISFSTGFSKDWDGGVGGYKVEGKNLTETYKSRLIQLHKPVDSNDHFLMTLMGTKDRNGFNGHFDGKRDITEDYSNDFLFVSTNYKIGSSEKSRQTFENLGLENLVYESDNSKTETMQYFECELVDAGECLGIRVSL